MASRALRTGFAQAGGAAAAALLLSSVASCSTLKRADDPPLDDAGNGDAGATDGSTLPDGNLDADTDAGPPPPDVECRLDAWANATKTKPECEARQVRILTNVAPVDVNGIAIARTPAGRVGIVYNSEEGAETGEMHLVHFTPTTPAFAPPVIVKRATGFAFHDGYVSKIAASAPDTLSVLAYDMDDTSFSGEVHLRKLVDGKEPLTDDLAFTAVKNPTEIALASDSAGTVYVTARISTGATTAKLSAKTKTATGAFTALADITTALLPAQAPGAGGASLFVDQGSQMHLLYHHNEVMQHSNPRYHSLAGTAWSFQKTVDNAIPDGISGFNPRVVSFGTKKYAAFFFRRANQPVSPVADLRLATWESAMDKPAFEIMDQSIPSPDAMYPAYRVAMAIDKYGLVHLAILRPGTLATGVLTYRRQTRTTDGTTKWLEDVVDSDAWSATSSAFVDMVVDENARPHIAYRSGADDRIRYATRYDR